ncbi:dTDP-4-dehydrorhamnose 3,5-epimerase [Brucella anthropi]|uniref:dTDP-4-dehydrorhamnose 3,5-epimerase n=1 Tax=Brucella anthropi TaxID=529 RepID=UPI00124E74D9|nr:dTDP-4-dehydrorhamnose 3,5-epimerase [Brucella anthropi]KAB2755016.1 dTDP-4-dehydrorhamnose 3,5-epimerase [Brucella anthropi]QOD64155.1 dTDP-4-dehydrorhamnose 3,5-epimerase [Ochrobactrum sp. MT180101]
MQIRPLGLDGVFEISPRKFGDDRGFFSETYNAKSFAEAGIDMTFVQDNHSYSAAKGIVRGLHYQLLPFAQDKLVRVIRGAILDVAVDIRKSSPTFGKWVALEVSAGKWNQILVPKGFAHGFMTLTENTEVIYKVTDYYAPEHDRSIRFDDPAIGIEWPIPTSDVQLSEKDKNAPFLADAEVFA